MTDSKIEMDSDTKKAEAPKKKKDVLGTLMVIMSVVAFGCLTAAIVMQVLEYRYYRGVDNPNDRFSSEVLIPPAS
jgi:hypothetical protein